MKKQTILAVVLLLVTGFTQAQVRFGVKAGLNTTWPDSKSTAVTDLNPGMNFQIGGMMQYDIWIFTLQPEVLFSAKSFIMEDANDKYMLQYYANLTDENPSLRYNSYNLDIPLNLQWGMKFGKLRYFVEAGPYVSLHLGGNFNGHSDYYSDYADEYPFYPFNWGLGAGIGAEYRKFQFKARWDKGYGKLGKYRENWQEGPSNVFNEIKDKNLSVSVGYFF